MRATMVRLTAFRSSSTRATSASSALAFARRLASRFTTVANVTSLKPPNSCQFYAGGSPWGHYLLYAPFFCVSGQGYGRAVAHRKSSAFIGLEGGVGRRR